jgi:hypothetical protein
MILKLIKWFESFSNAVVVNLKTISIKLELKILKIKVGSSQVQGYWVYVKHNKQNLSNIIKSNNKVSGF